jgi:ribose transport system permease protein
VSPEAELVEALPSGRNGRSSKFDTFKFNQEVLVIAIWLILFVGFSIVLPKFLTTGNIIILLNNVSILGTLAIGMGLIVVGRGIDLTMVALMVTGIGIAIWTANLGIDFTYTVFIGALFVAAVGLFSGVMIAFGEIPSIFTTLAIASSAYGLGRILSPVYEFYPHKNVPWLQVIGSARPLGIPVPIFIFAAVAVLMSLFLKKTRFGRFVHATGDNPNAARTMGLPTRPLTVAEFVLSALIGYTAGIIMLGLVGGMNTQLYNSSLVYDVILVVVLGGIGLSGGKGGVRNVIVGTIFVGTLINGMTILNFSYSIQNLIKCLILLSAMAMDAVLNPRDEQTSQSGDI